MTTKETNPKDLLGCKKVPFHLIPVRVLAGVAVALFEGACKYGAYNWRVAGVCVSVYTNAAERHIGAFKEGRDIDPDSGLHELDKAIASLIVLRDGIYHGNINDDRPPKAALGWLEVANIGVRDMLEKYPEPKAPYVEKNITRGDGYTLYNSMTLGPPARPVEFVKRKLSEMAGE